MKYKNGANNYHADAQFRLLNESLTVSHYHGDISAFHVTEETDLDIFSSTITFDRLSIYNEEKPEDVLEPEYEEYYHTLGLHYARNDEPQFTKSTLE